jgi:hypothetical protein
MKMELVGSAQEFNFEVWLPKVQRVKAATLELTGKRGSKKTSKHPSILCFGFDARACASWDVCWPEPGGTLEFLTIRAGHHG